MANNLNLTERLNAVGTISGAVDLVDVSAAQTLTNKTLTAPAISAPVFSGLAQFNGTAALQQQLNTPYVKDVTLTGTAKLAEGIGTFVSGVAAINTTLSTVSSFQATLVATGFATGATEITTATISGAITPTGSATVVNVQGFRLFTVTASASGTGTFHWLGVGT